MYVCAIVWLLEFNLLAFISVFRTFYITNIWDCAEIFPRNLSVRKQITFLFKTHSSGMNPRFQTLNKDLQARTGTPRIVRKVFLSVCA